MIFPYSVINVCSDCHLLVETLLLQGNFFDFLIFDFLNWLKVKLDVTSAKTLSSGGDQLPGNQRILDAFF